MQRRALLVATWLVGTAIALTLSGLAVRAVADRLGDPPRRNAIATATTSTTATGAAPTAPTDSSSAPGAPAPAPSDTAVTTPVAPPATGAPLAPGTYRTDGGVVVVTCAGDAAALAAASPAVGWTVDVRETGPDRVEVRFERAGADDGEGEEDGESPAAEAAEAANEARVRASCSAGIVEAEVN